MEKTSEIPFVVRTIKQGEDDMYIITVGKYQAINAIFDTKEEAEEYLNKVEDTIPTGIWELIAALSMAMTDWVLTKEYHQAIVNHAIANKKEIPNLDIKEDET